VVSEGGFHALLGLSETAEFAESRRGARRVRYCSFAAYKFLLRVSFLGVLGVLGG